MQLLFIGDILSDVFLGIILVLDTFIYSLISSAYKIFMAIASARLLSSDIYYDIASRIYIIIGVLMLFVLSYAILKAIVDPDQATKGDIGPGMVKRVVIAVVGLAIAPVLFNVLYQAQGLFLEQDVLGKVFFRIQNTEDVSGSIGDTSYSGNPDEQIKNIGGAVAATSIWQAFFYPADGYDSSEIKADPSELLEKTVSSSILCGLGLAATIALGFATGGLATILVGGATVAVCANAFVSDSAYQDASAISTDAVTLNQAYAIVAGGGGFKTFLLFIDNIQNDEIEYSWGISTICGAFALYAFASFSIDMGVRAAKLAYYQIIAPIPLIMQVLPKYKDTFSKYIKNVVSTFLEVFIRISVVYIVVYIICHLQDLFSSSSALWGNSSLNLAEKSLALAFLILGLVIFAKSAPDIICQSLNIEKGSMKLGIGKKLADGGAFAAGGVGYGAVTSAVRNWRDDKNKGFWNKARSAAAGFGSGAARAAFNQFGPGPGRKPAMNLHDLKNVGEKAAQGATDKRDREYERKEEFAAAKQAHAQARAEYDALLNDPTATTAQLDAAQAKMRDARKRMNEATAIGSVIDKAEKAIDSWSVGTVDLSRENADIKFATALNKIKDAAREEAFKKDNTTKALKTRYDELMAKQISEYRDGWDDNSYNEELRRRMRDSSTAEGADFIAKQAAYDAARRDADSKLADRDTAKREYDTRTVALEAAETALREARNRGADAATIATLENARNTAEAEVNTALADFRAKQTVYDASNAVLGSAESDLTASRKVISDALDLAAKRSDAELSHERMQLEKDRKAAKDKYEAAADAYVAVELAKEGSIVRNQLQTFISENSSYLTQNADRSITVGFNDDGTPKKQTVREIVGGSFGESAIDNGIISTDAVIQNNIMTVTDSSGFERKFRMEYTKDSNGKVTGYNYVDEADSSVKFSSEDFFGKIIATAQKAEASTRVTEASKTGKEAANAIPLTQKYMDKVTHMRQNEEGKK